MRIVCLLSSFILLASPIHSQQRDSSLSVQKLAPYALVWKTVDFDGDDIADTLYVRQQEMQVRSRVVSSQRLPYQIRWGRDEKDTITDVSSISIDFKDSGRVHSSIYDANGDGYPDIVVRLTELTELTDSTRKEESQSFVILGGTSLRDQTDYNIGDGKRLSAVNGIELLPNDTTEKFVSMGHSGIILHKRQYVKALKRETVREHPTEELISMKYRVWPNPSQGQVNIQFLEDRTSGSSAPSSTITVYSLEGTLLHSGNLTDTKGEVSLKQLDLSMLSEGTYVVSIKEGGTVMHVQKIIILH